MLLEVKDLHTSFKIDAGKVRAVNGVSFSVDRGKVLGIVGESGSGKSVTAYSILGIVDKNGTVESGQILFNGTDLLKLPERQMRQIRGNKISIIFQDAMTSLNPTWTIGNQIREAILVHAKNPIQKAEEPFLEKIEEKKGLIRAVKKAKPADAAAQIAVLRKEIAELKVQRVEAKAKAAKELAPLEKEAWEKFKAQEPALRKAVRDAWIDMIRHHDDPPNYVSPEEAMQSHRGVQIAAAMQAMQETIADDEKEIAEYLATPLPEDASAADRTVYADGLEALKGNLKKDKAALVGIQKDAKRHIKHVQYVASHKYKRARKKTYLAAKEALEIARGEAKSAYRETKWSANQKALHMLEEVGITEPKKRLKQYPFEHSGGMLQRCMIAMALVQKPDILIADEPTTALDVTIQAQILDLLKKLQKEYGMGIIIITHDLGVVAQICDEVDVMYAGRIVERGTVDDIFYHPQHEYTKGLLHSMPKLDSGKEKLDPVKGNPVDLFCLPEGCAFSSRCQECMDICLRKYPEEIAADGASSSHRASCWRMVKALHDAGVIDPVKGKPEGQPLDYHGAVEFKPKKDKKKKGA